MKLLKGILGIVAIALICAPYIKAENESGSTSSGGVPQPSISALEEIKATVNDLVKVVEAYPGDKNVQKRRGELRKVIEPRFDFREMSKRSLGANWNNATPEEQEEFVRLFSDLLASTYLNRIENIRANTVSVEGEKTRYPNALVKTMVEHRGDRFPIDYKLVAENGRWKIYDVIIENIGLVANYRNEFAGIIRREKMSGLLKRLREKSQTFAAPK